mmetsp:Transcript_34211/g.46982  ORF Transcript_34211/g.46982 Transcript_34211/m.46982 type:complete len:157 (+) Transcript_34211:57-527(+)
MEKSRDDRSERDKDKERKRRRYENEDDDRDKRHDHRRDRERDRDRERERPIVRDGRERKAVEVTHSVMIKGLPSHTTEPALYAALAIFSPKEIRLITQRVGLRSHSQSTLLNIVTGERFSFVYYMWPLYSSFHRRGANAKAFPSQSSTLSSTLSTS